LNFNSRDLRQPETSKRKHQKKEAKRSKSLLSGLLDVLRGGRLLLEVLLAQLGEQRLGLSGATHII
jgi:hypothetical protein